MTSLAQLLERALSLHQAGDLAAAELLYHEILVVDPRQADALHLLGMAAQQRGNSAQALGYIEQALALRPDEPIYQNNYGTLLQAVGRRSEAEAAYRGAIKSNPCHAAALNNLGNILREEWKLDEAGGCYRRALDIRPDFAEASNNLGNIFADQRRFTAAIACYRRALEIQPAYVEAHKNLGIILLEEGFDDEANAVFRRARELEPNDSGLNIRAAFAMPVIADSVEQIAARRQKLSADIDRLMGEPLAVDDLIRGTCGPVFHLAYQGQNDRELQAKIARLYTKAAPSLEYVAPHCRPGAPRRSPAIAGQVRVGIVSRFFHNHSIGDHYAGLIRNFPARDARYTVFRFPGPDDEVTRSIAQSVDRLITLPSRLEDAREQIARQQLDVLLYTDIGMDPWTYFLGFARLAEVQCVTLGQPVTTGIPNIDYFLSCENIETPDSDSHYTEKLVRLKNMPHYFARPHIGRPRKFRHDFGLPENARLYVCPQTLFKVHPEFDSLLLDILRTDPAGLVVVFNSGRPNWTSMLAKRMQQDLGEYFLRVQFLARQSFDDFLRILELADVLLDTIHFCGGTTTLQAMAVGTPLVTLPGEFARGRGSLAHFRRIDVLDTVAKNRNDYVRLAVRIANDRDLQAALRSKILSACPVLFDNSAAAIELEAFFVDAARRLSDSHIPAPRAFWQESKPCRVI